MSPNACVLEVMLNLHHVLQVGHGFQDIFGNILLAMHNIRRVSYEEVLHIHKCEIMVYTHNHQCKKVVKQQLRL